MKSYTINYLDNGVARAITLNAISSAMAEDVFAETYGEQFEVTSIQEAV